MYYTYLCKSDKNTKVYVGFTSKNPEERVWEHNQGVNKWTKANRPFKLVYYEQFHCEKDAKAREKFYKTGFGKKIKKLIVKELENVGA